LKQAYSTGRINQVTAGTSSCTIVAVLALRESEYQREVMRVNYNIETDQRFVLAA